MAWSVSFIILDFWQVFMLPEICGFTGIFLGPARDKGHSCTHNVHRRLHLATFFGILGFNSAWIKVSLSAKFMWFQLQICALPSCTSTSLTIHSPGRTTLVSRMSWSR